MGNSASKRHMTEPTDEEPTQREPALESTSSSSSSSSSSQSSYSSIDQQFYDDDDNVSLRDNSVECYRISLFQRKSDPLTLLGTSKEWEPQLQPSMTGAALDTSNYPSALRNHNSKSAFHGTRSDSKLPSISDCATRVGDDEEEEITRSSSPVTGCVTSPLALRTMSWSNLLQSELVYTQEETDMVDGDQPTLESDLQPSVERGPKHFWIVTTAALPWMTGTAVNPLLRAAYLSKRNRPYTKSKQQSTVTLVIPWLESPDDRVALYGPSWEQSTPDDQAAFLREWLRSAANLPLEADKEQGGIQLQFYPSRYHAGLSSIFAMGDLCQLIPENSSSMVCILEEPEHVNFYRAPGRLSWRDKFQHVVGIVHTNYKAYASSHYSGIVTAPLVGAMSSLMVRAYCDKVVKLSPVLQPYAPEKEVVSNVHGIRSEFFNKPCTGNKIYFIGKLLWAKGLDKILDLQSDFRRVTGDYWEMDIFGSGPEQEEIKRAFLRPYYGSSQKRQSRLPTISPREWRRQPIPARFMGRKDHAQIGEEYKIFVNPSITEVLCTTTAESIAMGKWVICPAHPSNQFFSQFPNCLQYSSKAEFVQLLQYARSNPTIQPLDTKMMYPLTWEAATDRLLESACISKRDARRRDRVGKAKLDERIAKFHYEIGRGAKGDVIRKVLGAGPVAGQHEYEQVFESPVERSTDCLTESSHMNTPVPSC